MFRSESHESVRSARSIVLGMTALSLIALLGVSYHRGSSNQATSTSGMMFDLQAQADKENACRAVGAETSQNLVEFWAELQQAVDAKGKDRARKKRQAIQTASRIFLFPLNADYHFSKNAEKEFGRQWKTTEEYSTANVLVQKVMRPAKNRAAHMHMTLRSIGRPICRPKKIFLKFRETFRGVYGTKTLTGFARIIATVCRKTGKVERVNFVKYHERPQRLRRKESSDDLEKRVDSDWPDKVCFMYDHPGCIGHSRSVLANGKLCREWCLLDSNCAAFRIDDPHNLCEIRH